MISYSNEVYMKGGYRKFAGRPGWHSKTTSTLRIDIHQLYRKGFLSSTYKLTWGWKNGSTVVLVTSPQSIALHYRYRYLGGNWNDVEQRVAITRTTCHFGKDRPWFLCPNCHKRVAMLYIETVPLCRKCAGLVYHSQSDDAIGRSWRRTRKIERKLAAGAETWNYFRPKGMRQATYERLLAARAAEKQWRDREFVAIALREFPDLFKRGRSY
jgi:hypothetical protein